RPTWKNRADSAPPLRNHPPPTSSSPRSLDQEPPKVLSFVLSGSEGEPGSWTILLEYWEFTGNVKLVVESTEEEPEVPDVPPPSSTSVLLDEDFGTNGRATYTPGAAGGRRVVLDSLDRPVVCGTAIDAQGARQLIVLRYTSSGKLDTDFGDEGVFTYGEDPAASSGALDLAVDSSNRILVCGWVAPETEPRTDLLLLRLKSSGALDHGFATEGVVQLDEGEDEAGTGVAIDEEGRILVAGASRTSDNSTGEALLLRYESSGELDTAFADDGIVRTSDATDRGLDVGVDSSNHPVLLGIRNENLALWKFDEGGAPQSSFGSGGIVTSAGEAGEYRVGRSLLIGEDNSLFVTGVRFFEDGAAPPEMVVWRYRADGQPLTSFNGSGFLAYRHPDGWAAGASIATDSEDRILVAGVTHSTDPDVVDASATLWRFYNYGSLDTSLPGSNGTGQARFDVRSGDAGTAASSLFAADHGKFLVAGSAFVQETGAIDLLLWRLEP
ncbi:MAG: hypothetical protein AB1486_32465, partial [Planctomycetota bacterium]